ncbi:MAG TPA: hypothetical protein PK684_04455 [Bacillota bacterium]|jgi:hypothetical protein|nr:hypothetical protein [Bacillota bacterium]
MKRITRKTQNNGHYVVDEDKIKKETGGYSGEAIERLAAFENMYEDLIKGQGEISEELERLRREGKKNSYKFRELMGKKLINSNTMIILKNYGLE